jgi:hypothetical protein
MIIITGTGRSGTTFLAYLFMKLGYSLGCTQIDFKAVENPPFYGGGEDLCSVNLNTKIHDLIVPNSGKQKTQFENGLRLERLPEAALKFRREILSFPHTFIKDPRFSYCLEAWLLTGKPIDLIIDCWRNLESCGASMIHSGKHPGPLSNAIKSMKTIRKVFDDTLNKYKNHFDTIKIPFPECLDDPALLKPLFLRKEFSKTSWKKVLTYHKELARKDLIHC